MIGRLEFVRGTWGGGEVADLYGMDVLRVRADPAGYLARGRLLRAGHTLRRGGVVRTLLPREFSQWKLLEQLGLYPVDPAPFLREQAPRLAVESLRRRSIEPGRAVVALSGQRADGEMYKTAARLCREVRHLVISAPSGGEALARRLRWEFGVPVLPEREPSQLELRFHPSVRRESEAEVELYGREPKLDGMRLRCETLREEEQEDLSLMSVLWQRGKLESSTLKFT